MASLLRTPPSNPSTHPPACYIGGHQDVALACLKFVEGTQALGLTHLAVDWHCPEAKVAQQQGDAAGAVTSAGEDLGGRWQEQGVQNEGKEAQFRVVRWTTDVTEGHPAHGRQRGGRMMRVSKEGVGQNAISCWPTTG
eukprot:1142877-Pelagomonas_calceolata.AAC.11